jgi:hypothetical protein
MNNIYLVINCRGRQIPFVASYWDEARRIAREIGGRRHRGITLLTPGTPAHRAAERELGLV